MVSRETLTQNDGTDFSGLSRHFVFLSADNIQSAIDDASENFKLNQLEIIDTTKDFNQNKWLGKELKNTLIYINNKTSINAILSITACVIGGYYLLIVYDKNDNYDYFKKNILFSQLKELSDKQKSSHQKEKKPTKGLNLLSGLLKTKQRIIHLIGERGTGKSTLLGHYINKVIQQYPKKQIIFSSPCRESSANALRRIKQNVSRETFRFIPPSEVKTHLDSCDILIIDEAASMHSSLLKTVLHTQSIEKILLATTTDGYEGTGQSYRLNFLAAEENCQIIELNHPKRYSPDDEFHLFSQRLCQPKPLTKISSLQNDGTFLLSHKELREKQLTLPVFTLLRDAHYRSTPNDLARFYDDSALFVIMIKNHQVIAAAHVLHEQLPERISITDIINGTRRPKNAMTQQMIIHAYANKSIADSKILRISRIAVDKTQRRKHYASNLIKTIINYGIAHQYDFISTSFSGNKRSLKFWLAQKFIPVRIGLTANKWNDEFAILMSKPLTSEATQLNKQLSMFFYHHFSYFYHHYNRYDKTTAEILMNNISDKGRPLQQLMDKQEIIFMLDSVIKYHRNINWILPILSGFPKSARTTDLIKTLLALGFIEKSTKKEASQLLYELRHLII